VTEIGLYTPITAAILTAEVSSVNSEWNGNLCGARGTGATYSGGVRVPLQLRVGEAGHRAGATADTHR